MRTVIFLLPQVNDSHSKNRILEFIQHGIEVEVYGFEREGHKVVNNSLYEIQILGKLKDGDYLGRIWIYLKAFASLGRKYKGKNTVFFLFGLDIAMFFHAMNPSLKYIYEECDLTHTYTPRLKSILEIVDKRIIKSSLLTFITSEGFIKFHFGNNAPENVCKVENKLNPSIIDCHVMEKRAFDKQSLSVGFVGYPRFDSIYNFIDVYCRNFPQCVFHIFGGPDNLQFEPLKKYGNCIFHGSFKNPIDLPSIYSQIDMVLATYDVRIENVLYAEPNKIYESIYFETPIIVSKGTFLAEKVKRLGIGFEVDAFDDEGIVSFINGLSANVIAEKIRNAKVIDKKETLNVNEQLFVKLKNVLTDNR